MFQIQRPQAIQARNLAKKILQQYSPLNTAIYSPMQGYKPYNLQLHYGLLNIPQHTIQPHP